MREVNIYHFLFRVDSVAAVAPRCKAAVCAFSDFLPPSNLPFDRFQAAAGTLVAVVAGTGLVELIFMEQQSSN